MDPGQPPHNPLASPQARPLQLHEILPAPRCPAQQNRRPKNSPSATKVDAMKGISEACPRPADQQTEARAPANSTKPGLICVICAAAQPHSAACCCSVEPALQGPPTFLSSALLTVPARRDPSVSPSSAVPSLLAHSRSGQDTHNDYIETRGMSCLMSCQNQAASLTVGSESNSEVNLQTRGSLGCHLQQDQQ